jgi:hypothetical protein
LNLQVSRLDGGRALAARHKPALKKLHELPLVSIPQTL